MLSERELNYMLIGAEILGCGGGGAIENGQKRLEDMLSAGKRAQLITAEEVPQDGRVFVVGFVGGGISHAQRKRIEPYLGSHDNSEMNRTNILLRAIDLLSETVGSPFAFISSEIGAGNMMAAVLSAAMKGVFVVDGDCCGRAKPEISISTTNIAGISVTPMSLCSLFGDEILIRSSFDDQRAEDMARSLASASAGVIGCARTPITGSSLAESTVRSSITSCISLGRKLTHAKQKGRNPITQIVEETGSYQIFEGTVVSSRKKEEGGFLLGNITLKGKGSWKGSRLRVDFKNEYLVSFLDGKPYVCCPDLIMLVNEETGSPLSIWRDMQNYEGCKVIVLGKEASSKWMSTRGLELFSPSHFGYSFEHKSLKAVIKD